MCTCIIIQCSFLSRSRSSRNNGRWREQIQSQRLLFTLNQHQHQWFQQYIMQQLIQHHLILYILQIMQSKLIHLMTLNPLLRMKPMTQFIQMQRESKHLYHYTRQLMIQIQTHKHRQYTQQILWLVKQIHTLSNLLKKQRSLERLLSSRDI